MTHKAHPVGKNPAGISISSKNPNVTVREKEKTSISILSVKEQTRARSLREEEREREDEPVIPSGVLPFTFATNASPINGRNTINRNRPNQIQNESVQK